MDYEKYYDCIVKLLNLGFDLEKNNARDLLNAINECYEHYEEYFDSSLNS